MQHPTYRIESFNRGNNIQISIQLWWNCSLRTLMGMLADQAAKVETNGDLCLSLEEYHLRTTVVVFLICFVFYLFAIYLWHWSGRLACLCLTPRQDSSPSLMTSHLPKHLYILCLWASQHILRGFTSMQLPYQICQRWYNHSIDWAATMDAHICGNNQLLQLL